ncbi:MAG: hypothetical protein ACK415_07170 [Thermodesulfovibrionales bacterium]
MIRKLPLLFILIIATPSIAEERYTIPIENSPSYGPENAPVTIIEFLDYQ